MSKALIAMSGGVDSTLAAKLIHDRGYECIGCTMKLYDNEDIGVDRSKTCCSLDDVEDARSAAFKIGMPYYVFGFRDRFEEKVIRNFVEAYEKGMTPNPCIDCNRYLKFEELYRRAQELGCDHIVTGHYARIEEDEKGFHLKKALDDSKDQSYVLYSLTQEQLAHTLFPLGSMHKTEVREIAESCGFLNADKPDSQDICFVPDGDYKAFICRYTGKTYPEGDFVDTEGQVLGRHKGIIGYTVGQRKGLGIAFSRPLYVVRVDAENNRVVLGDNSDVFKKEVHAVNVNWISGRVPEGELRCRVKVRYRQKEQEASVFPVNDTEVRIVFDAPQRAVTPGQAAVFYLDDEVLGGGTIVLD